MKSALALAAALMAVAPAAAQPAAQSAQTAEAPSPALRQRAEDLLRLFRGEGDPATMFTPEFLRAVPAAQLQAITAGLAAQHGRTLSVAGIEPRSATAGMVRLDMERAVVRLNVTLESAAPQRIIGLLVVGVDVKGDTLEALLGEFRALPGQSSLAVARLGDAPAFLARHDSARPMAVGSAFKLFILAELDRQIRAGQRRWSDVVPIDRHSPSGPLQQWPAGAPVTLHTLASLMISQSDNTATDILLHIAGREAVERIMPQLGMAAPERNRPFLSTLEAFVLKSAPDARRQAWIGGNEATRRRILATDLARIGISDIDAARIGTAPASIDTIEWFASADDLVRTMDWLRRNGSAETQQIMAINAGIPRAAAEEFAYLGYKGGSEPGVINMTFLVRNRAGAWHVVAGSWNNVEAAVDNNRFAALMQRALQLVR